MNTRVSVCVSVCVAAAAEQCGKSVCVAAAAEQCGKTLTGTQVCECFLDGLF